MKNFYPTKRKMEKMASKAGTIVLIMILSLSLVFYNFSWTFLIARASEDASTEIQEEQTEDKEEVQEEDEQEEESQEEENQEEESEEEEIIQEGEVDKDSEEVAEEESQEEGEEIIAEATPEESAIINNDQAEEILPEEESQKTEEEEESNEEFWKSCEMDSDRKSIIEEDNFEDCRKLSACGEIVECITVKIENTNEAEIKNEIEVDSNTGGNEITTNTDDNSEENSSEINNEQENISTNEQNEEDLLTNDVDRDNPEENNELQSLDIIENEPEISTGEAVSALNVVNEVNTNIVSNGYSELLINIEGKTIGDVNLLEKFQEILDNASNLVPINLEVKNDNTADIDNEILATASTGKNEATGDDAQISTGDALALANVVNIANTNIVGNNWIFSIINVLGEWVGDLILPGEGLLDVPISSGSAILDVTNENEANIDNEVSSKANTGENLISGVDGETKTGEAVSQALVTNIANTNIVRNNWLYLIINNMGVWTGKVIGWDGEDTSNSYSYDFDLADSQEEIIASFLSVYNKNVANVYNEVSTNANTGENFIFGDEGGINTGNAMALSKVFNFVNTNIVGNNWIFSVVNVMGSWKGNAVFAYPDLAVDISADKEIVRPGEKFNYKVMFRNNGQARSDNTRVEISLANYLNYKEEKNVGDPQRGEGILNWRLPGLAPGEEKSFEVAVQLDSNVPKITAELISKAEISTDTKEEYLENNRESASIKIDFPIENSSIEVLDDDSYENVVRKNLDISRKISPEGPYYAGALVTYEILVKNNTKQTTYNLNVEETIRDPQGDVIGGKTWTVEKLKHGQKAIVRYQVVINPYAMSGIYENTAQALGYSKEGVEMKSEKSRLSYELIIENFGIIGVSSDETIIPVVEASQNSLPVVSGVSSERKIAWQWLLLLLLIPVLNYIRKKKNYNWGKLQKLSRRMASLLSSFF